MRLSLINTFASKLTTDSFKKFDFRYLVLCLVLLIIFIFNYKPNTYLIGWDNLQTELNPVQDIQKNFSSVWQEYQGLGLVAGNAHAVEFFRSIIVLFLTFILPNSFIRYFIHFLYIFIGVIFAYKLFKKLNVNSNAAFLGALFYLFNLGTVQNFYAPFEPFSAFYAFLPFTLFYLYNFISAKSINLKNSLPLTGAFLLLTFAFQVPTLFIVYFFILGLISVAYIFSKFKSNKEFLNVLKRIIAVWSIFTIVNLFWLLPFVYSLTVNIDVRNISQSTRLSTENVKYQNQSYSNWTDISVIKGFWFANIDYDLKADKFVYMLDPWIKWQFNPAVPIIGYLFFAFVIFGLLVSVITRSKGSLVFLPILFLSLFFFFGSNGVTGPIYQLLIKVIPPIGEAFRFAFTKWVTPLALAYSFFFAEFFSFIFNKSKLFKYKNFISVLSTLAIFCALIFYMLPIFKGDLFYDDLRRQIPNEYKEVAKYFNDSANTSKRIVMLPINTIWGWSFTDWGFKGSGFIWYMIPQSILSRTFDVWSINNEQFYHEFQYALYSQNPDLLNFVINKYQVDYIVIDQNVVMPNAGRSTFYQETKDLLSLMPNVSLDVSYNDKIYIYKTILNENVNQYVYAPENFYYQSVISKSASIDANYSTKNPNAVYDMQNAKNKFVFADDDVIKKQLKEQDQLVIQNPFIGDKILKIYPATYLDDLSAEVTLVDDVLSIHYTLPQIISKDGSKFLTPITQTYPLNFGKNTNYGVLIGGEVIDVTNSSASVHINKSSKLTVFNEVATNSQNIGSSTYSSEYYDCAGADGGKAEDKYPDSIKIFSQNKPACVRFAESISSPVSKVYKISFDHKVLEGSRVYYCLRNKQTNKCENEIYTKSPFTTTKYSTFVDYVLVNDVHELNFELILETETKENYYEASVKNINLDAFEVVFESLINTDQVINFKGDEIFLTDSDFPLTVKLPSSYITNREYKPDLTYYNLTAKNCDRYNQNSFGRAFDSQNNVFEYSAVGATSCDNVKTEFINPNNSYLITFDSQNIKGKGLDICVTGVELEKCLIQDRLKGDGKESFILPRYPSAKKVNIYLENQSIGKTPTVNRLNNIMVKEIPYNWLKQISIQSVDHVEIDNAIALSNVEKFSTYKYLVEVKNRGASDSQKTDSLIILNQSYEKGWTLYDANTCLLGVNAPFFCKVSDAKHVLAKNWANGWLIPAQDATYLIIFWPQYLQFFGYFIFAGFISPLLFFSIIKFLRRSRIKL